MADQYVVGANELGKSFEDLEGVGLPRVNAREVTLEVGNVGRPHRPPDTDDE